MIPLKNRYNKIMRYSLLLASLIANPLIASSTAEPDAPLVASAPQEERSWLQKTFDFCKKRPVDTVLGGVALTAGSYLLASRFIGTSKLVDALPKTSLNVKLLGAITTTTGLYSLFAAWSSYVWGNNSPLAFVGETVKKDLIGSEPTEEAPVTHPSAYCHLGHALRISAYGIVLKLLARTIFPKNTLKNQHLTTTDLCSPTNSVFTIPICEELLFTYIPNSLGNFAAKKLSTRTSKAKYIPLLVNCIMPIFFGRAHSRYDLASQANCALGNFLHHRSLITRPEYPLTPILNHMLNNFLVTKIEL